MRGCSRRRAKPLTPLGGSSTPRSPPASGAIEPGLILDEDSLQRVAQRARGRRGGERTAACAHALPVPRGLPARRSGFRRHPRQSAVGEAQGRRPTNGGAFGFLGFGSCRRSEKRCDCSRRSGSRARIWKQSLRPRSSERVAHADAVLMSGPFRAWRGRHRPLPGVRLAQLAAAAAGGRSALVLPRARLSGSALAQWRRDRSGDGDVRRRLLHREHRQWVFRHVHPQYTIGLTVIVEGGDHGVVRWAGPFTQRERIPRWARTSWPRFLATSSSRGRARRAFPADP